jgi:transcription initiation factor TFIID subunit 8
VLAGLRKAGFDGSDSGAMKRLEAEVVECTPPFIVLMSSLIMVLIPRADVKMLFERAHELADLANRSGPIVTDLLLACKERNVDPEQLRKVAGGSRGKKRKPSGTCFPLFCSLCNSPSHRSAPFPTCDP